MAAAIQNPTEGVVVFDEAYAAAGAAKVPARVLCETFRGVRELPPDTLVTVRWGAATMTGPARDVLPQAFPRMTLDEGNFCALDPDQLVGTKDYRGLPELVRELRGESGFPWRKVAIGAGITAAVTAIAFAGWKAMQR